MHEDNRKGPGIHEYQSRNCNKGCEITLSILWWVVKRRREIWMLGGILWYVGNYANFSFLHNLWNKIKINVIIRYDLIVLSYCFMYQILYRTFGNHAMKLELEETFRPKKIVKDKEKRFLSWCILRWVKDEYLRISRTDLHWQN